MIDSVKHLNNTVERRIELIKKILSRKGKEYAHGDRLSNFYATASFLEITPEKAALNFVTKHIIALRDFINLLDDGVIEREEQWDEKIGDIINYMIIIDDLVKRRREEDK